VDKALIYQEYVKLLNQWSKATMLENIIVFIATFLN